MKNRIFGFNELAKTPAAAKINKASTVWSNKKQKHTSFFQRYKFLTSIKANIPDLDIYGADHMPLDDKADALIPCRYHIAI